ncbi:alpha/beta hydrolase family [Longilinea arvoryzae]|uniref:Alpha/beta hydrolase family n=1 Tax=Longilinea arvoryzae TaxID=360412 RepID=A0A0S7BMC4_9CHLR|nr:alpha/beta fold hydrolase [Longilinea arvoryzae]GAP15843.1 alpha/beta hydrolase family [Longilinea arvoryzae]
MLRRSVWIFLVLVLGLAACSPSTPSVHPTATHPLVPSPSQTPAPSRTPTALPSPTPTSTPTPDPYADVTVAGLRSRTYGSGELEVVQRYGRNADFTRYEIRYPSDGLSIAGFMNVPNGEGPFPVIIAIHGYIEPGRYNTLDYSATYADSLAQAGYLVLHPNLRGYTPSDDGPNRFRAGYAVDVLNLIAILEAQAGRPGPLEQADPDRLGLWGHSMGGGVAIRVMVVSPEVDAVALYGSMSADDDLNFERINTFFKTGNLGIEELQASPEDFARISPVNFLADVRAAVSIHHGGADLAVPPAWSDDLCQRLQDLGKDVECFSYPGQPHTFIDKGDTLFRQRVRDFFDRVLKADN